MTSDNVTRKRGKAKVKISEKRKAAMDHEPRMNRIRGRHYLKFLRLKLCEIVGARSGVKSPTNTLETVEVR